jgi:hypothetical protein
MSLNRASATPMPFFLGFATRGWVPESPTGLCCRWQVLFGLFLRVWVTPCLLTLNTGEKKVAKSLTEWILLTDLVC